MERNPLNLSIDHTIVVISIAIAFIQCEIDEGRCENDVKIFMERAVLSFKEAINALNNAHVLHEFDLIETNDKGTNK
jgi:hypothetical protein